MSVFEIYNHLLTVTSSERFLSRQGLGNEVPFFICPYKPEEYQEMSQIPQYLKTNLKRKGIETLEINLYDLSIEILKERDIWDQIIENETTIFKEQLKELLQGVLDPEDNLVPKIASKLEQSDYEVLFITGVGQVFPYIRSHNVLNNLQSTSTEQPTIMFFPGSYEYLPDSGTSLVLFGKLHDDKYYRAFNILNYEV